ncbi:MAG: thioredoxin domain-containing protein [Bacteroidales bacterium]|jgi:uncharacterized protein YyaL (SSP411 family)|nr:thioredoxin domain-containing protein [Bacteroidales bacterium]
MPPNKLINESSPYLLHHAHNPVNWYPWGAEALDKARSENKLLIISIGYAACHWCHVMEKESFSDPLVAKTMNKGYVSIKIDREERPDLDQIYMDAAMLTNGSGGWPLNVIALPDGRPVFAGTYFPKEKWIDILEQIQDICENDAQRLFEIAEKITDRIRVNELSALSQDDSGFDINELEKGFENWIRNIDLEWGGYKHAPKFPLPAGFNYLLKYHYLTKDKKALQAVTKSLDRMARGGIYDHVGGGFARYSVDEYWKVPHFEKMLYDNAQLISLYTYAYQFTRDPFYKKIVAQTIEFCNRELSDTSGLFYSSLDADSEGKEGEFYVWEYDELKSLLGEDHDLFADYYNIKKEGNWEENKNILFAIESFADHSERKNLNPLDFEKRLDAALAKLFRARSKRIRPGLDDKCITAWNSMMVTACLDAYRVFDHPDYLKRAKTAIQFILKNNTDKDYKLYRIYKNGKRSINGFLDDYASTIQALIELYQLTFDIEWIRHAEKYTEHVLCHFSAEDNPMLYYTSDSDPELIARKTEVPDNVIPSSNSIMANNLYFLGLLLDKKDYRDRSLRMLSIVKDQVERGSPYYANWASLYLWQLNRSNEVVIMGAQAPDLRKGFNREFLPLVLFAGSKNEENLPLLENRMPDGKTMIYVCKNKTCNLPVSEVQDALKLIHE